MAPESYELHEGQFVQRQEKFSAADATNAEFPAVPDGKVWTALLGLYTPSVAETKVVWWSIVDRNGINFPITRPVSIALSTVIPFPLVTEGLEIKVWPRQKIRIDRDSATAGSSMYAYIQIIETDLPFYQYKEPQRDRMFRRRRGFPPDSLLGQQRGSISPHEGGPSIGFPGQREPGGREK